MFTKKELKFAYTLAACLLIVGAVCYAALPEREERQPLRLMFRVVAGNVLFDHDTHTSDFGYAISCGDCHHTLAEDEYADAQSCSECHDPDEGDEEVPKRADAFHQQCAGCHEEYGAGPLMVEADCNRCHVK
jgi:hypothetical protein